MENYEELISDIINLSKIRVPLHEKERENVYSMIISSREKILKKFGLPFIPQNWFKLVFSNEFNGDEAVALIERIRISVDEYFSKSIKSDIEILDEARLLERDPLTILPQINIEVNSYTFFLFQQFVVEK